MGKAMRRVSVTATGPAASYEKRPDAGGAPKAETNPDEQEVDDGVGLVPGRIGRSILDLSEESAVRDLADAFGGGDSSLTLRCIAERAHQPDHRQDDGEHVHEDHDAAHVAESTRTR